MADYFTLADLEPSIPPAFLIEALDDDGDGVVDAFEGVRRAVQTFIDGMLSTRYATPFDPVPKVVASAAQVLACEACYKRRGVKDEENPWYTDAKAMRALLTSIAKGDIQLQAGGTGGAPEPAEPAGTIIEYESRLGAPGRILA